MEKVYNVGIIGTGFIANEHAEVLKNLSMTKIVGVYDIQKEKAAAFARKHSIPKVFSSTEEITNGKLCDCVHVVVPPPVHHTVAIPFLHAGISVFLEKPMAISSLKCQELVQSAETNQVKFGINHNYKFHPTFMQCKQILSDRTFGKIHHIIAYWNVPLRQLKSKKIGHWMFQDPGNIILEQGVHPLSQIIDLAGDVQTMHSMASGRNQLAPGKNFWDTWQISMECEQATAQLFFSVGQEFPSIGLQVICNDGQITVDCSSNFCVVHPKTKWPEYFHSYALGRKLASSYKKQGLANFRNYVISAASLQPRSDAFFLSMSNSISAFYKESPDATTHYTTGKEGARTIEICEMISASIGQATDEAERPELKTHYQDESFDIVIIGGTGFIGTQVVKKLVRAKKRVLVVSRNIKMLPEVFYHPNVWIVSADIVDREKMDAIIANIPMVIHLAHGGGGDTWEEIEKTMVGGTRHIANACLRNGTKRLLYIGTIASLYLGNKRDIITGNTPVDPKFQDRGLYSRGKTECENILLDMQKKTGLPVCILRPAVVVGKGGLPFHSGIGLFNQDAYCLGWNMGHNALPLVLVEDVAEAIVLATLTEQDMTGNVYNLVGDVCLTAREYIEELGKTLGRKLHYSPQLLFKIQAIEIGKWIVKHFLQRRKDNFPSYRDLKSRGMVAKFDCSDIKQDLLWKPEDDRDTFIKKGIAVYQKR